MSADASRYAKTIAITAAALLAICVPSALALPADRAYEKVSPEDKDGNDIISGISKVAIDGDAANYSSFAAFSESPGGGLLSQYYSERTPTGWTTVGITPAMQPVPGINATLFDGFSDDVATAVVRGSGVLAGGDPTNANIYRTNPDQSIDLISFGQPDPGSFPNFDGGSSDLSQVTFDLATTPALDVTEGPDAPPGVENAYVGNGVDLELVSVLPDGTAAPDGGTIGSVQGRLNAVSDDGATIYWSSNTFPPELYVRLDGATTEWASESQRNNPDPNGVQDKTFQFATADGSSAFFTSGEKLTNNSQAEPGVPDLYRYDVGSGNLTDLTTADPDGAGMLGVLGVSSNGNRVYFAANGALAPGATDGQPNLYVRDGATTTFIADLDTINGFPNDTSNWSSSWADRLSRVTPDGQTLLFGSRHEQLGYDNAGFMEFYLYDLAANEFTCVSCRPNGAPATAETVLLNPPSSGFTLSGAPLSERQNLTNDGSTAFFVSGDRLLQDDTNGKYDVYMWDDGTLDLVSTGTSSDNSSFAGAGANGDDAMFLTRQKLVGIDTDNDVDLYDARVGGGIASQNPPPPPPPCQAGADCQPPAPPESGPPPNGTTAVDNPVVPPPPDCSSAEAKAEKKAKKVDKLQKKVGKASGQAEEASSRRS